jgi:Anti-sigma-K factor rskA, C-terminal
MGEESLGIPEHRETVSRLERGVARVTPPDDLFDRVLEDVRPAGRVIPFRRRRLPVWATPAGAAALAAAAAVAITLAVTRDDGLGDPVRRVSLNGRNVRGTVALYRPEDSNGVLVVDLDRVPRPPRRNFYEIWLTRPGSDQKIPIGSFTPRSGKTHLELPLPGGKYLSVDISVEDENGPPEHSGRSIAAARLA